MIPLIVILIYLTIIAVIGGVAYQRSKNSTEDFFLASRTIGSVVFFLSLFATNMTAFAILGSSGKAYREGIGVFGLMASSSGIVIPLTIFFIGTRLWSLGKRFGHMTQVAFFRDRWECSGIGTFIFSLSVVLLVPYMIISIMGGGTVLEDISRSGGAEPLIKYSVGCFIVALVVTINVFFGGMRGTVWVNVFQTILFLCFGLVAAVVISSHVEGGFGKVLGDIAHSDKSFLLSRERMPAEVFWSYMFIPLSSIMFPHMSIMCLSAQKMSAFKRTVVVYPLAIMAIWLPCVFLGVIGSQVMPGLKDPDGVLLHMLSQYAPVWLAGILGAGIISAVMGSDCHQVLAVSTMFTKDVFDYYGGRTRFGEKGSILFARIFIVVVTGAAYFIAIQKPTAIFDLAVRFAFSGFAALAPIMIAALFWKRSTKFGALASASFVALCVIGSAVLQVTYAPPGEVKPGTATAQEHKPGKAANGDKPVVTAELPAGVGSARPVSERAGGAGPAGKKPDPPVIILGSKERPLLYITPKRAGSNLSVMGYMPVVPMVLGSALFMILFSMITRPPGLATINKYFPPSVR